MLFHHRTPRPPLDTLVASIWVCRDEPRPHALERILPSGSAQLIINLKENETRLFHPQDPQRVVRVTDGTILTGPWTQYQVIDTSEQEYVAGVAFRPGGSAGFMKVPAHETRDTDTPLELIWGRQHVADLRDRLLEHRDPGAQLDAIEAALADMLRPAVAHPAVAFALRTFDRAPLTTSIERVTDAIGMSAKRFIERFKAEVGVSPKRYCRIRRFQRAVARAHRGDAVDWTQVALECGYYDQAHFIHEFRSFSGLTPTGYVGARTAFQNHVKFLQSSQAAV